MRRRLLRVRYCGGCGVVVNAPRVRYCPKCKAKRTAQRVARAAKLTRKQRAELKLRRLRERIAAWETKRRRAENALKKCRRALKSAEKRYAWANFVGWDKTVPMPRERSDDQGDASSTNPLMRPGSLAFSVGGVQ